MSSFGAPDHVNPEVGPGKVGRESTTVVAEPFRKLSREEISLVEDARKLGVHCNQDGSRIRKVNRE